MIEDKPFKASWQLLLFLLGFFLFPISTFASSSEIESDDLSILAVLPDNQQSDVTYFDLLVTPKDQQIVMLKVVNQSKKDKKLTVNLYPAMTNRSGFLSYGKDSLDESIEKRSVQITEIATVEKNWLVKASASIVIPIKLSLPEETFSGIVLGGIEISEVNMVEKETKGFSLNSDLSYVVGLQLQEEIRLLKPELKLERVYASQNNGENEVVVELFNPVGMIIKGLEFKGTVTKIGNRTVAHSVNVTNWQAAPNQVLKLGIDWAGNNFEKGRYELELLATESGTGKTWSFKQEFTITEDQVAEFQLESNPKKQSEKVDFWSIVLVLGSIVASSILILGIKKTGQAHKNRLKRKRKKHKNPNK